MVAQQILRLRLEETLAEQRLSWNYAEAVEIEKMKYWKLPFRLNETIFQKFSIVDHSWPFWGSFGK